MPPDRRRSSVHGIDRRRRRREARDQSLLSDGRAIRCRAVDARARRTWRGPGTAGSRRRGRRVVRRADARAGEDAWCVRWRGPGRDSGALSGRSGRHRGATAGPHLLWRHRCSRQRLCDVAGTVADRRSAQGAGHQPLHSVRCRSAANDRVLPEVVRSTDHQASGDHTPPRRRGWRTSLGVRRRWGGGEAGRRFTMPA